MGKKVIVLAMLAGMLVAQEPTTTNVEVNSTKKTIYTIDVERVYDQLRLEFLIKKPRNTEEIELRAEAVQKEIIRFANKKVIETGMTIFNSRGVIASPTPIVSLTDELIRELQSKKIIKKTDKK